jgi:Starch synthase catalytic domain
MRTWAQVWGKTGAKLYGEKSGADFKDNQKRFKLFSQAALEALRALPFGPGEDTVVVVNDWHTALLPVLLKVRGCLSVCPAGPPGSAPLKRIFLGYSLSGHPLVQERAHERLILCRCKAGRLLALLLMSQMYAACERLRCRANDFAVACDSWAWRLQWSLCAVNRRCTSLAASSARPRSPCAFTTSPSRWVHTAWTDRMCALPRLAQPGDGQPGSAWQIAHLCLSFGNESQAVLND